MTRQTRHREMRASTEIRVVIADDEALARSHLHSFFDTCKGWRVVGEASSGPEACQLIDRLQPDVVFLDIRMPGQTGMGVARTLARSEPRPLVVFATAFDEHALEAFEVEAADYLLKPFDRNRFLATVGRLERRLQPASAETKTDPLPEAEDEGPQRPNTLAVRSVGRVRLVEVAEVQWVAAAGNYVRLYLDEVCLLHRSTLAALEGQLDPGRFLRIHRSTLVQRAQVVEIRSSAAGRSQVVLRDGTELEISQRFRQRALEALVPPG